MQNQPLLLVFAQSARFIAESATRAGFTVRVADCFGDTDTLRQAEKYIQLPPITELSATHFHQALLELANKETCYLIFGTGVEKFYPELNRLPTHITLIGPSAKTIEQLRQPKHFFSLLDKLTLNYPITDFNYPQNESHLWLAKSSASFGGGHVTPANISETRSNDIYYQHKLDGQSASACFITDGQSSKLLTINEQHQHSGSYQLKAISAPLQLNLQQEKKLHRAIQSISRETDLKGINSIDFIIHEDDIFILEVNPRISASAELIKSKELFNWHFQTYQGQKLADLTIKNGPKHNLLYYVFADKDIEIPASMSWPTHCHDIPSARTTVLNGQPICTIIIEAASKQDGFTLAKSIEKTIFQNLLSSS